MINIVAILCLTLILILLSLNLTVYRTREDVPNIPATQSSATGNWNSGVATSGSAGADLLTITISDDVYINFLEVVIGTLTNTAVINIRMYHDVNGTERKFYDQPFTVGTDADSIPAIDGTIMENGSIRLEVESDQGADDAATINYEYK